MDWKQRGTGKNLRGDVWKVFQCGSPLCGALVREGGEKAHDEGFHACPYCKVLVGQEHADDCLLQAYEHLSPVMTEEDTKYNSPPPAVPSES